MLREYLYGRDDHEIAVGRAAWMLEDAIHGKMAEVYPAVASARETQLQLTQAEKEYTRALIAMTLLAILETPSWCETQHHFFDYLDPEIRCKVPGVEADALLLSNVPYIPPGIGLCIELCVLFFIFRKLLLERKLQKWYFSPMGIDDYINIRAINFGIFMVCLQMLDIVVFALFRPKVRIAFICRSGFLALLPAVQNLTACIRKVMVEVLMIGGYLIATIILFAWVCVTVFNTVGGTVYGQNINKGLDTLETTLYTMFVAGSSEDFVEAFLPSYTAIRASGILWFSFLVLNQVLLWNLVLDTLVAAYTRFNETTEEIEIAEKLNGIRGSFSTLCNAHNGKEGSDAEDELSKEAFLEFVAEYSRSSRVQPIAVSTAEIVFRTVDKDQGGTISVEEFCTVCGALQYQFWTTVKDSPVKDAFPRLWNHEYFQKYVKGKMEDDTRGSSSFDVFMNYVLALNLVLVVLETMYDLNQIPEPPVMERLELIFSCAYVTEIAMKLCVYSWGHFWSFRSNQFDFFTTWLLLGSSMVEEIAVFGVKRYFNILRLLRLLRVVKQLKSLPSVQFLVNTMIELITASREILTLMWTVIFFFSSFGVQLWGGLLYRTNEKLEGTEYEEKDLFVLNFNDFLSSFGLWVVMLLCEYVVDFPEAITAAGYHVAASRFVFMSFYFTGVMIVFELVKAFTIEVFLDLYEKRKEKEKKDAERKAMLLEAEKRGEEIEIELDEEEEQEERLQQLIDELDKEGLTLHWRIVGDISIQEKIQKCLKEEEEEAAKAKEEE